MIFDFQHYKNDLKTDLRALELHCWVQNGISTSGPTTWIWHCCNTDIAAICSNNLKNLDFNFTLETSLIWQNGIMMADFCSGDFAM